MSVRHCDLLALFRYRYGLAPDHPDKGQKSARTLCHGLRPQRKCGATWATSGRFGGPGGIRHRRSAGRNRCRRRRSRPRRRSGAPAASRSAARCRSCSHRPCQRGDGLVEVARVELAVQPELQRSLSMYTTRASGATRRATSWVLSEAGMPAPMSRNWRTPCSAASRWTARHQTSPTFTCTGARSSPLVGSGGSGRSSRLSAASWAGPAGRAEGLAVHEGARTARQPFRKVRPGAAPPNAAGPDRADGTAGARALHRQLIRASPASPSPTEGAARNTAGRRRSIATVSYRSRAPTKQDDRRTAQGQSAHSLS